MKGTNKMAHKNNDILDPKDLGTSKRQKTAKVTKASGVPVHGLWGVLLLIVCASIIYANYRVFFGVEELIPRIMLAPSTIAVALFLVYKSAK
jgi:hypothetical protein